MMMVVSKITIQVLQGLLLGELVATYPTHSRLEPKFHEFSRL